MSKCLYEICIVLTWVWPPPLLDDVKRNVELVEGDIPKVMIQQFCLWWLCWWWCWLLLDDLKLDDNDNLTLDDNDNDDDGTDEAGFGIKLVIPRPTLEHVPRFPSGKAIGIPPSTSTFYSHYYLHHNVDQVFTALLQSVSL